MGRVTEKYKVRRYIVDGMETQKKKKYTLPPENVGAVLLRSKEVKLCRVLLTVYVYDFEAHQGRISKPFFRTAKKASRTNFK